MTLSGLTSIFAGVAVGDITLGSNVSSVSYLTANEALQINSSDTNQVSVSPVTVPVTIDASDRYFYLIATGTAGRRHTLQVQFSDGTNSKTYYCWTNTNNAYGRFIFDLAQTPNESVGTLTLSAITSISFLVAQTAGANAQNLKIYAFASISDVTANLSSDNFTNIFTDFSAYSRSTETDPSALFLAVEEFVKLPGRFTLTGSYSSSSGVAALLGFEDFGTFNEYVDQTAATTNPTELHQLLPQYRRITLNFSGPTTLEGRTFNRRLLVCTSVVTFISCNFNSILGATLGSSTVAGSSFNNPSGAIEGGASISATSISNSTASFAYDWNGTATFSGLVFSGTTDYYIRIGSDNVSNDAEINVADITFVTPGITHFLIDGVTGVEITTAAGVTLTKTEINGGSATFISPQVAYVAPNLADGTSLYLAHQQTFTVAAADVDASTDTIALGNDSNSQAPAFASSSPYTNVRIQATAGATLPTTSPQIVDGGRYYATISSGDITLFVSEANISGPTPITISAAGTDSGGSVFRLIAETELVNMTISGGSGASEVLSLANGDRVVRKARYWASSSGTATASPLYIQEFAWSTASGISDPVTVNVAVETDEVHEEIIASTSVQLGGRIRNASGTVITSLAAANDGSALDASSSGPYAFMLEGGGGRVQVNASDSDGLSLWQDFYVWGVWVSSTAPGIRLINAQTLVAINSSNFVFDNFEIDNTSSVRLSIVGGNGTSRDGSSLVAATQTGSGGINPNALSLSALLVFETGTSGLTSEESTALTAIATRTARVDGLIEDSSGDRFTAKALEESPAGGGGGDATAANQTTIINALAVVDGIVDAILVDTAEIGAAGDGLTNIPTIANVGTVGTVTNAVTTTVTPLDATATQAAAAAALNAYDPPTRAELTSDIGTVTTAIADVPTVAEFEARTLPAADYFAVGDYTAPDDAATIYSYFTSGTRPDPFKANISALLTTTGYSASLPANFGALAITETTGLVSTSNPGGGATAQQVWEYAGGDRALSGPQATAITSSATLAQVQAAGFTTDRDNALLVESRRKRIDFAASTLTLYAADGTTPLQVFDLLDADGNPATTAATAVDRVPQ